MTVTTALISGDGWFLKTGLKSFLVKNLVPTLPTMHLDCQIRGEGPGDRRDTAQHFKL